MNTTSVLIVGAGPVGMTLALTLRRSGIAVVIVDKETHTRQYSQAALLWPRTLEVLDLLGIVGDWQGHTVPFQHITLNVDGDAGAVNLQPVSSAHPFPAGVGQDVTEALLDARLRASGADYRRGVEVTAVRLNDQGGEATLRDRDGTVTTVSADWVVGCEGSHSLVREAAGISWGGSRNAGIQLIQGDVRVGGSLAMAPGHGYLWSVAGNQVMLVLPTHVDGHCRVLIALPDDGGQGAPTLEQLESEAQKIAPGISLTDPSWLNRFQTEQMIAGHYRRGRAFVVGDTAHVWVPIGGQGMNIGMQDAFDLGWKLAGVISDGLPDPVLDTYHTERRPIGEANIALTTRVYHAILSPSGAMDRVLRKIVPYALDFSIVGETMSRRLGQTDFHYNPSLIVSDHAHSPGPAAGNRAPDAYVSRDGLASRLYDLYRAGRWTILGWAVGAAASAPQAALSGLPNAFLVDSTRKGGEWTVPVLRDLPQSAAEAYHVDSPQIHVIRPDGVIGYRGPADRAPLETYLKSIGKA